MYTSNQLSLLRAAKKVIAYLDTQVEEEQHLVIEDVFPIMQTVQHMFPQWVLQTCVFRHPNMRFISPNCLTVFGYSAENLIAENYPLLLLTHIHEEDREDLHQCFLFIEKFLRDRSPEECVNLRFVFNYRIRHAEGHYITVHDEKATLHVTQSTLLNYSLFRDTQREAAFTGVNVIIYERGETLNRLAIYKPSAEQLKLSRRENDILELIKKGLTNKEIAYNLDISPNTARNIRQKMFLRYGVTNIVELLNKTIYYN